MGRIADLTILGALAVLLGRSSVSDACSCALEHPQTKFCRADFVALVRVKHSSRVNDYEAAYRVNLHRIFKATPEARTILERKPLWIWSSSYESMCGVSSLDPGKTWLIGGRVVAGKASTSLCGLATLWSKVTPRQRKGFAKFYHRGCACEISYTEWSRKGAAFERSGGKRCLWESSPGPQNCQESYGVCTRDPNGCSWLPTVEYNRCVMRHQRHRVKQQARDT